MDSLVSSILVILGFASAGAAAIFFLSKKAVVQDQAETSLLPQETVNANNYTPNFLKKQTHDTFRSKLDSNIPKSVAEMFGDDVSAPEIDDEEPDESEILRDLDALTATPKKPSTTAVQKEKVSLEDAVSLGIQKRLEEGNFTLDTPDGIKVKVLGQDVTIRLTQTQKASLPHPQPNPQPNIQPNAEQPQTNNNLLESNDNPFFDIPGDYEKTEDDSDGSEDELIRNFNDSAVNKNRRGKR